LSAFYGVPFKTFAASAIPPGRGRCSAFAFLLILGGICFAGQTAFCAEVNSGAAPPAASAAREQIHIDRFFLDLGAPPEKRELQIPIPTNGTVQLTFMRSVPTGSDEVFAVYASDFYGETSGDKLPIRLLTSNLVFNSSHFIAPVELETALPSLHDTYIGALALTADGQLPIIWRVALIRATGYFENPASLAVVPGKVSLNFTRHFLRDQFCPQPVSVAASAVLQNSNKYWPIAGFAIVPGEITAGDRNALSIVNDVRYFLNGTMVSNLMQLPPGPLDRPLREIFPGGQVQFGLGFQNLSPGEYTFELNFKTLDSVDDESRQKLTVNVKVRDSVSSAVLVLIAGIIFSFLSYKWVTLYKQRIPLLQRVNALRVDSAWARLEAATYPVVWTGMYLRQAEELASRLFFTSPSLITERLDRAESVINALNVVQKLNTTLSTLPQLMRNRFSYVIDGILDQLHDDKMTKSAADKARADLEKLHSEIADPATRLQRYWTEVKTTVTNFKTRFDPGELGLSTEDLKTVTAAADTLWPGDKVPENHATLDKKVFPTVYTYEETYARLWLLYERKLNAPLVAELVKEFKVPLDRYFEIVDDHTWKGIKASAQSKTHKLTIMTDSSTGRAYEPLGFRVSTGNEELNRSYLFKHKLRYRWTLQPTGFRIGVPRDTLRPISNSPYVIQFASHCGKLAVSVQLSYKGETADVKDENSVEVRVKRSADVRLLTKLERTEKLSLFVAGIFAAISGLLTFYYKNPVFGTVQDYLSLFIWAAGVDLTKNVLQSNQPGAPNPSTTPTHIPPAAPER